MGVAKIFDSGIENLNRKSDLPSPDLFNPGIDIQNHKYGDFVRRNVIQTHKPDTIGTRQQFTAKIMYKGRDITVDNVYKVNQNFANKFENSASKKVIKVYQVWIPQLNICQRAPTTKGSACVNHGAFSSLNDAGLRTIAEDTKTIQEIKTAYIETYPGVPNAFMDKFPHVGDKVLCVVGEPTTFEDIKIISLVEPMAGSTSLKISPRAKKSEVGITMTDKKVEQLKAEGIKLTPAQVDYFRKQEAAGNTGIAGEGAGPATQTQLDALDAIAKLDEALTITSVFSGVSSKNFTPRQNALFAQLGINIDDVGVLGKGKIPAIIQRLELAKEGRL